LNYQFIGYSTEEVAAQGKDFKLNEHRCLPLCPSCRARKGMRRRTSISGPRMLDGRDFARHSRILS